MQITRHESEHKRVSILPFHPLADMFPPMTEAEFSDLVADIDKHGLRQEIDVWQGQVLEGCHRAKACEQLGIEPRYRERRFSDESEARAYVISQNIHRRHLTVEQKRYVIAALLKADPTASNRKIAETAKVDKNTVANQRKKMETTGEIHQLKKTVGKDNKPRTTKPRRASEPRPTKTTVRVDADSEPKCSRLADVSTLNATWNAASREQRRAFVNEIGLVELYAQASNAQQQKLADMIRDMDAKEATRPNRQRRSDGSRK